jgi:hypothetical protein
MEPRKQARKRLMRAAQGNSECDSCLEPKMIS